MSWGCWRRGGTVAAVFTRLFHPGVWWEGGWGQWNLRALWCLSPDFHEVWPTEVETERQNRSKWQTDLGWRRNGVPAPDNWINFHQGTISSLQFVVFAGATAGWSIVETCARDFCLLPLQTTDLCMYYRYIKRLALVSERAMETWDGLGKHPPLISDMVLKCLPWPRKTKERVTWLRPLHSCKAFLTSPSLTRSQNSKG